MIYLVDSSCFMTASRVTYPIDIAVSFWNKISEVTEEVSAVNSKKDIKLPDACNAFGVRSINFMQMRRELKVQF